MVIKVVGFRDVNFNAASGDHVEGTNVYYLYADRYTTGNAADKIFIRSGRASPFELNKKYNVSYNRYGKFDLDDVKQID